MPKAHDSLVDSSRKLYCFQIPKKISNKTNKKKGEEDNWYL